MVSMWEACRRIMVQSVVLSMVQTVRLWEECRRIMEDDSFTEERPPCAETDSAAVGGVSEDHGG